MGETDPERLADDLGREADELEQRSDKLGEQVGDVAHDWERKRSDPGVPGAPPPAEVEEGPTAPTGTPTGKGGDDEG
jgi:hypothetical protein